MSVVHRLLPLLLVGVPWFAEATEPAFDEDDYGPLVGHYELVGRRHDSTQAYAGTVTMKFAEGQLRIERWVGKVVVKGTAHFESRTADRIRVLVMEYREGGESLVSQCMVGGDLDNDLRLTCLVGSSLARTPGVEALFMRAGPE